MPNEFHVGQMVWAKFFAKHQAWPGIIIQAKDCGLDEKQEKYCVFWMGTKQFSLVPQIFIQDFRSSFEENTKGILKKTLQKALEESVKMYARRHYNTELSNVGYDGILTFMTNDVKNLGLPEENFLIPSHIMDVLKTYTNESNPVKRKHEEMNLSDEKNRITGKKELMHAIKKGEINVEEICMVCYSPNNGLMHPFFTGGLCLNCKEQYLKTVFVYYTVNLKKVYCYICGDQDAVNTYRGNLLWTLCNTCILFYLGGIDKEIPPNKVLKLVDNFPSSYKDCPLKKKECIDHELGHLFLDKETILLQRQFLRRFPFRQSFNLVCLSITQEHLNKKGYRQNLARNKLFFTSNIEFKTLHDMKKDLISVNATTLVIGHPCSGREKWYKSSEKFLTVNNIQVEFFFEFYKLINDTEENIMWFYEMPASIQPEFRELISRFTKISPFVIEMNKHEDIKDLDHYENLRLIWSNTAIEFQHMKEFFQVILKK